jgi:zinc transport system substrate-binding protein
LPQKDFVKAIGGDYVTVKELIPPGSSPATYELKPQDLIAIEEADIYFRIGYIPFEKANIENIKEANPSLNIVDTSENVNLRYFGEHEEHSHDEDHDAHEDDTDHDDEHADDHDEEHEEGHEEDHADEGHDDGHDDGHDHSGVDPHIWLSPEAVELQIESIYSALASTDSENAAYYRTNADAYIAKLDDLHESLEASFSDIETKTLMVFHPAWGYLADEYGLEQLAIEQSGKEPTASQLQEIIDEAKAEGVRVIFVQKQFDVAIAESIAEEIGAAVVQIDPLAEDYIANMESIGETINDYL